MLDFVEYQTSWGLIIFGCELSARVGPGSLILSHFFFGFLDGHVGFGGYWLFQAFKNGFFLVWLIYFVL